MTYSVLEESDQIPVKALFIPVREIISPGFSKNENAVLEVVVVPIVM